MVGLSGAADGSYSAPTAQIFGEGAYKFAYGKAAFEPFANLAYVHIDGNIDETGTAAMTGSSEFDTTYTTLGLRASAALSGGVTVRGSSVGGMRLAMTRRKRRSASSRGARPWRCPACRSPPMPW